MVAEHFLKLCLQRFEKVQKNSDFALTSKVIFDLEIMGNTGFDTLPKRVRKRIRLRIAAYGFEQGIAHFQEKVRFPRSEVSLLRSLFPTPWS